MPIWPFSRSRAAEDAERLLEAVQAASRRPAFFGPGRVADTLEGRFELVALNAALALIRLKAEPGAEPLAQDFTDRLFKSFDAGLREAAVGDLSVPKRMRRLAGDFYGRANAYGEAVAARDAAALCAAIARNVVTPDAAAFAERLAAYAERTASQQAGAPLDSLLTPQGWPAFEP
jgi:cytochrome b pre-mRNA-processing protein 3